MMKIKVADLYNLSLGLADLADKELPISISLKIQRNQKAVSEELISSDKVRQKIIKEHTEKKLDDGLVKLTPKGIEKMDELMEQEIEIELQDISLEELEGISIKPKTLTQLKTILNENGAE